MISRRIPSRSVLAGLILFACASLNPLCGQQPVQELEVPIVNWTNYARQQKGLQPLQVNPALEYAARLQAWHMAIRDHMAHEMDGSTPVSRVQRAGYAYRGIAENIAFCEGYANPAWTLFDSWMRSSGHYHNLMTPAFSEIGVGVYRSASGKFYACQVFGAPLMMAGWTPGQ